MWDATIPMKQLAASNTEELVKGLKCPKMYVLSAVQGSVHVHKHITLFFPYKVYAT
jgi:hypothetical protein